MTTDAGERRYERKYRVEVAEREVVEAVVRTHPATFREIHSPRYVNNLYFDTPSVRFYSDHVSGISNRLKVRLRWYGDPRPDGDELRLEFKAKDGAITSKSWYAVAAGALGESPPTEGLPADLKERVLLLRAALFNRYRRRYFLSRNGRFRVTVDSDLEFARPGSLERKLLERYQDPGVILELKHSVEDSCEGAQVSSRFPFAASKNSKYVTGMSLLLQNL